MVQVDTDYNIDDLQNSSPPRKKKYEYVPTIRYKADYGFPGKYCYSHDVLRGVKLALYATVHTLTAKYHMSDAQVEGSIKKIANMLFGQKWKEYFPNQPIDKNSLPCLSNLRRTGRYARAIVLCSVVKEIMNKDTKSCMVYSNNGS